MWVSTLWSLLALSAMVVGDWPGAFNTGWLAWRWQTCVVFEDWLYIDGGEYYSTDSTGPHIEYSNFTFSIDLSQSWTVDSVQPKTVEKSANQDLARRTIMWYDGQADTVFSGGGWSYYGNPDYSIWSFSPDGEGSASWHISTGNVQQYTPTFASAFTATNDTFYSLGGADPGTTTPTNGLETFAFDSDSWNTESSAGATPSSYSLFAEAVYMPIFGKQGLIAFLGGETASNGTWEYETGTDMVDMSNITIFDTQAQTWYHQTATGDIPPPRSEFCAIGTSPADNSSFEIFVYGGSTNSTLDATQSTDTGYTDIYVLSLPSFTWFKTNSPDPTRRANHYCQLLAGSNMLVVGGRNPSNDANGGFGGTDPWPRGMNVFDMVGWTWTSKYDHEAVYTRPSAIQKYIDSNPATPNWSDPTLASLFAVASSSTSGPASTSGSGSASATSSAGSSKPASSHTGAIVGGVVGGVAFIAFVVGIIFFCLARKRKQRRSAVPTEDPDAPTEVYAPTHKAPVYEAPGHAPGHLPDKQVHEMGTPVRETSSRPAELSAEGRHL